MTTLEILEAKQESNKWLKELTSTERLLIIEMMDEAMEIGRNESINVSNGKDISNEQAADNIR